MRVIYTIVVVLLILFVITFSLENAANIPLKYYDLFNTTIPVYMLIFLAFLVGVVFTGLMGVIERFQLTRTINKLNKTVRDLRRELRDKEERPIVAESRPPDIL